MVGGGPLIRPGVARGGDSGADAFTIVSFYTKSSGVHEASPVKGIVVHSLHPYTDDILPCEVYKNSVWVQPTISAQGLSRNGAPSTKFRGFRKYRPCRRYRKTVRRLAAIESTSNPPKRAVQMPFNILIFNH